MASYDLKCGACGKEFEVFQLGFLKEDAKVCPACGSKQVEQRFTGFGGVTGLGTTSSRLSEGGSCPPGGCCSTGSCGCGF
jgi:putative FmdB family regulatory protein